MFAPGESNQHANTALRPGLGFVLMLAGGLALAVSLLTVTSGWGTRAHDVAASYPAEVTRHIGDPATAAGPLAGGYGQPADAALLDGVLFVLDTENDRILAMDRAGTVRRVITPAGDDGVALDDAMAIASDGDYLWVANSGAGEILAMESNGRLVRKLALPADGQNAAPRPVGLAIGPGGQLLVSDIDNNRLFLFDREGNLMRTLGGGARSGGSNGLNAPGGVAFDSAGNLFAVDILNARVVKFSPEGQFLRAFGRLGDTGGTLSRPKDVAVDGQGNVYVSDGLLAAVQVFDPAGEYAGVIGRSRPDDAGSKSLFVAPAGLELAGDNLYVVDRFAGVLVFRLPD